MAQHERLVVTFDPMSANDHRSQQSERDERAPKQAYGGDFHCYFRTLIEVEWRIHEIVAHRLLDVL